MEYLSIIFSGLAAMAAVCAIITFIATRKDRIENNAESLTTMKNDIKYTRDSVDDIQLNVKDVLRKQNEMTERLAKDDIRLKELDRRVSSIERRMEYECKHE